MIIYEPVSYESLNDILGVGNRFDLIQIIGDVPKPWYQDVDAGVIVKIEKESIWKDGIIQSSLLKNIWKEILTKLKFESAWENFEKLIDIYFENNLLHTMYHIRNYIYPCTVVCENRNNCIERNRNLYFIWKNVRNELQQYIKKQTEFTNVGFEYVQYALVYACTEMNHICYRAQVEPDYETETLLKMSNKIIFYDTDFYMNCYLNFRITIPDCRYILTWFMQLQNCIKYSKTFFCKSNFSLTEANWHQSRNLSPNFLIPKYEKSYNLNKKNYRAIFKLATCFYQHKKYIKAEYFSNLVVEILRDSEDPTKKIYRGMALNLLALIRRDSYSSLQSRASLAPFYREILTSVQNVPFFDEMFINEEDKKFFSDCLKSKLYLTARKNNYENSIRANEIISTRK